MVNIHALQIRPLATAPLAAQPPSLFVLPTLCQAPILSPSKRIDSAASASSACVRGVLVCVKRVITDGCTS